MKLTELWDIRPEKIRELRARIDRLGIDVAKIEERFVKGGGKGGQKINKTANCVVLTYPPLGIQVRCRRDRRRSINRFLALRALLDRIEASSPRTP